MRTSNILFPKTTHQAIDSPESIISRFRKTAAAPYKSVATPIPDNIQFNSEVPCARSNVKLEYKEDRGRFLVASEDIKPGVMIITKQKYS